MNNVGTNVRGPTTELDEGDYRAVLETNLDAAVFLCRDCKAMLEERSGCVVNIGSISGVCCDHTGVAYAVSKAGFDHLTRYLACEWGPCQVRVNSVDPWFIRTELTEPLLDDADFRAAVEARTPLRRSASRPTSVRPSPTCVRALRHRAIVCGRGPDLQRVRVPKPSRQTERTTSPGGWVVSNSRFSPSSTLTMWLDQAVGGVEVTDVGVVGRTTIDVLWRPAPTPRGAISHIPTAPRRQSPQSTARRPPAAKCDVPLSMRTVPECLVWTSPQSTLHRTSTYRSRGGFNESRGSSRDARQKSWYNWS